jgi:tetratricopeptide (TPR) repeat protein
MRRGLALFALFAMSAGPALAGDKTDFAAELKKIENASRQGMISPLGRLDAAKMRTAQAKANAEYEALAKKAETADPKTLTPEDMAAVAQANLRARRFDAALKWAELGIKADAKLPSAHEAKVRALVQQKKSDEAAKALSEAPALSPQTKSQLNLVVYQAMAG